MRRLYVIVLVLCVGWMNLCAQAYPEGAIPGAFIVNDYGERVAFSQGNLQCAVTSNGADQRPDKWFFAAHQYDFLGEKNITSTKLLADTIDWFGWSGNAANAAPFGVCIANMNSYYEGTFLDWGMNAIQNGGNIANGWRTLTSDEWRYVWEHHTHAVSAIEGINGLVVLPADSIAEIATTYTLPDWQKMEQKGALFLPFAGYRQAKAAQHIQDSLCYWSASSDATTTAQALSGNMDSAVLAEAERKVGMCVRLVTPIKTVNISISSADMTQGTVAPDTTMTVLLGTSLALSATPQTDYHFVQWSDGSTDNPRTVIFTTDSTIQAFFEHDEIPCLDPLVPVQALYGNLILLDRPAFREMGFEPEEEDVAWYKRVGLIDEPDAETGDDVYMGTGYFMMIDPALYQLQDLYCQVRITPAEEAYWCYSYLRSQHNEATAMEQITPMDNDGQGYTILGMPVSSTYKGLVIYKGVKQLR